MRAGVSLAALVLVFALGGVGVMAAAGEEADESKEASIIFTVKGTLGYRALVLGGRNSNDGKLVNSALVLLYAKHDGLLMSTRPRVRTELIEGEPTVTSFEADFGRFGEIAVHYVPTGRNRVVGPYCGSERITLPVARYEGAIELHGEEGFTDVSATSAPSRPEVFAKLFCHGHSINESVGFGAGARLMVDTDPSQLLERRSPGAREVSLQANANRPGGPVWIDARFLERRGQVGIERQVSNRIGGRAFAFASDVSRARFSPGSPFSGRGIFDRAAGPRNRWRGNLTVDFPGRPNIRLTGPGFGATLDHAHYELGPPIDERFARAFRSLVGR